MAEPKVMLYPMRGCEHNGYIDSKGKDVIEAKYEVADKFVNGLARVKDEQGWAYIDTDGKKVIEGDFGCASRFSDGYAAVSDQDGLGWLIDRNGKRCSKPIYEKVGPVRGGVFRFKLAGVEDVCGYAHVDGRTLWQMSGKDYASLVDPSDGVVALQDDDGAWGLYDALSGKRISKWHAAVGAFREGIAPVCDHNGRWGAIDRRGDDVMPHAFDMLLPSSGGLLAAKCGNGWGFVDHGGRWMIAPDPDIVSVGRFSEELCNVQFREQTESPWSVPTHKRYSKQWGYIDSDGRWVIAPVFDSAQSFRGELALVQRCNGDTTTWSYIDRSGEPVWSSHDDESSTA